MIAGEIGSVCLDAVLVDLAGEDALTAVLLESHSNATNPGEKVDECESCSVVLWARYWLGQFSQRGHEAFPYRRFTSLPSLDGSLGDTQPVGDLLLGKELSGLCEEGIGVIISCIVGFFANHGWDSYGPFCHQFIPSQVQKKYRPNLFVEVL
jgi:hypothetical protein